VDKRRRSIFKAGKHLTKPASQKSGVPPNDVEQAGEAA
jgi:hypothetical protein